MPRVAGVPAALTNNRTVRLRPENWRHRANYMLCLVIGTYCEGVGLVLRVVLRDQPHSTGLYIAQYLFVVLSVRSPSFDIVPLYQGCAHTQPCAFLAGDYILLGRIVSHLNAPQYIRPFKPGKISWTFVISDGKHRACTLPARLLHSIGIDAYTAY